MREGEYSDNADDNASDADKASWWTIMRMREPEDDASEAYNASDADKTSLRNITIMRTKSARERCEI